MKLAISNIAWTNEEEPTIASLLQKLGVKYVELAPTKRWDDPTKISREEVENYKVFWQSYGIEIVAFQSMLFNRPDLKLFENEDNRQATLDYLKEFIRLAGEFGASAMVFGSPKNRQRGELAFDEAQRIAIPFFEQLGQAAQAHNTQFCIEPNATQYACDFITNAAEGIALVKMVDNPGFGLHLDMGCMTLAGDNVAESIKAANSYLGHFHISAPMLKQVDEKDGVEHTEAAAALRNIGYSGFVSIEMRPADNNLASVEKAVKFARSIYSS